jgi:hypothetical protein
MDEPARVPPGRHQTGVTNWIAALSIVEPINSLPAPTELFLEKEQRIVEALRTAADSPVWTR